MSFSFCPRCDAKNAPGVIRCQACGLPLTSGTMVMGAAAAIRPTVSFRVVRADGGPEAVVEMQTDTVSCGRQGEIAILDDPFVAEVQARFFFNALKLVVEDVAGGNGVFIRLRQDRELTPGAEVRLGRQRLLLESLPPPAPGADGAVAWGSPDPGYRFLLVQILEAGVRGAAFPLKEGDNLLGREVGEVTFPQDGFVSSRHALLHAATDRVIVRDIGSSNGTFVRVFAPAFVDSGDQFLIGRQLVRVEISAAD